MLAIRARAVQCPTSWNQIARTCCKPQVLHRDGCRCKKKGKSQQKVFDIDLSHRSVPQIPSSPHPSQKRQKTTKKKHLMPFLFKKPSELVCIFFSQTSSILRSPKIQVVAQMSKSLESTIAEDEVHEKLCHDKNLG